MLVGRLEGRTWIMGDEYTIADIATLGWVDNLIGFYEARELVEFDRFGNVAAWLERGLARPARSEEHTSELQSLMRISYAVFCLKKQKSNKQVLSTPINKTLNN